MQDPAVEFWIALGLVALLLAMGGRWWLRRVMSGMKQSMANMVGGNHLGLNVLLVDDQISFTFASDQITEEFARLNAPR